MVKINNINLLIKQKKEYVMKTWSFVKDFHSLQLKVNIIHLIQILTNFSYVKLSYIKFLSPKGLRISSI